MSVIAKVNKNRRSKRLSEMLPTKSDLIVHFSSSLLPVCFQSTSGLLLVCFWSASGLLLVCFRPASSLLPVCFQSASGLLLVCFWSASGLLPVCCQSPWFYLQVVFKSASSLLPLHSQTSVFVNPDRESYTLLWSPLPSFTSQRLSLRLLLAIKNFLAYCISCSWFFESRKFISTQ